MDALSSLTALNHLKMYWLSPDPTFSIADLSQAGLRSLYRLEVSRSHLTVPVSALSNLSSLTCLHFHNVQLTHLECSSCWQQLRSLSLSASLDHMPSNLSALTALTCLHLSFEDRQNFQLHAPLHFIEYMPSLSSLWIRPPHVWSSRSIVFLAEADQYFKQVQGSDQCKCVSFDWRR